MNLVTVGTMPDAVVVGRIEADTPHTATPQSGDIFEAAFLVLSRHAFRPVNSPRLFLAVVLSVWHPPPGQAQTPPPQKITIYPDQVVNHLADPHPLGINVNFFNDNDRYLKPPRKLSAALKEMGVRYLRYPGGDKSDYYLFSVPPYDRAVATPSQAGLGTNETRAQFYNADRTAYNREVLNFDDFMTVCREAGCEPVITCAIDTYVQTKERLPGAIRVSTREDFLQNAVEWVRYANVKHHYGIRYWMLGNESWVAYYKTATGVPYGYTPEMYARDLVDFSAAMKAVDPTIQVVANGVDWTIKTYLPTAAASIDAICTSNYPVRESNPLRNYQDWVDKKYKNGDLAWETENAALAINKAPIDAVKKSRLPVITSEFGPYDFASQGFGTRMDLGHALFNFDMIGQLLSMPRNVLSLFWNTRWEGKPGAYDALYPDNRLTPLGQSLALWGNSLFPDVIRVSQGPGLVCFATCDRQHNQAYFYVVNQRDQADMITLETPRGAVRGIVQVAGMSGTAPNAERSDYFLGGSERIIGPAITLKKYSAAVFKLDL